MREPKKKKITQMSSEITLSSFFCSLVVLPTLVCAKCVDDQTDRQKKYKQIERGAAKLLWWHFHFFFFRLLFSPIEFHLCFYYYTHKKSDDLAFRVWQIATHTHTTHNHAHSRCITSLGEWHIEWTTNWCLSHIEKHLWVIIVQLLLLLVLLHVLWFKRHRQF